MNVCAAFWLSTSCPNCVAPLTEIAAASPVPVRANWSDGVPIALLLIVMVAVRTPAAFGEKPTLNVVLPPARIELTEGCVTVKSPACAPVTWTSGFPIRTSGVSPDWRS